MYPFNFITAVGLNQIVIFPVKEQSNLLRKYGSSRRIFNDVQGCTVLFLYFQMSIRPIPLPPLSL